MRLIIGVLILLPVLAVAETAYVTDSLRLGLHAAEDVRLPDGAEGWVKSAYLVDDKPAKLIVAETIAERDRLAGELEQAKAAFADPAATIEELRGQARQLSIDLGDARSQIAALRAENASIQGLKERYRGSVPLRWVGGVIAVCLIAGILIGLWWVDYRSRKRHGGIRIY
jgi:uncharacterized membrane protein YqiK